MHSSYYTALPTAYQLHSRVVCVGSESFLRWQKRIRHLGPGD